MSREKTILINDLFIPFKSVKTTFVFHCKDVELNFKTRMTYCIDQT